MGKLTLLMFGCAFLTFVASVIGLIDPSGAFAGLLVGGFLGIGFFITGPWWLGMKLFKATQAPDREIDLAMFEQTNVNKLVDYIDERANESVVSNNNEWLKRTWHSMNDGEKQAWVKLRLVHLKIMIPPSNSAGSAVFITALQNADKEYQRQHTSVAS